MTPLFHSLQKHCPLRPKQEPKELQILKIAIDAYIPEEYIATSEERMIAYKRISSISSLEESEKLKVELASHYGQIPNAV